MYEKPLFFPAGDMAIVVELGDGISPQINRKVRSLTDALEQGGIPGVFDFLPTYRSVLVYYDPLQISSSGVQEGIERLLEITEEADTGERHIVHLPTLYGGEMGADIEFVAQHTGIDEQELIRIHSGTDYLVYMMGFSPGFAYLGGLDERLATPRLQSPRTEIPAGASRHSRDPDRCLPDSKPRRLAAHRQDTAQAVRPSARASRLAQRWRLCALRASRLAGRI